MKLDADSVPKQAIADKPHGGSGAKEESIVHVTAQVPKKQCKSQSAKIYQSEETYGILSRFRDGTKVSLEGSTTNWLQSVAVRTAKSLLISHRPLLLVQLLASIRLV